MDVSLNNNLRINPFIGEINYKTKDFIIMFVTISSGEIELYIGDKIIKINAHGGKVTRFLYNAKEQSQISKIDYYIDGELLFTNMIRFDVPQTLCFISGDYGTNGEVVTGLWSKPRDYGTDTNTGLWDKVSCDICFHIGNNIYADPSFHEGVKLLKDYERKENKKNKHKYHSSAPMIDVENLYRECYQNTWNRWSTLLPQTSHIAIWDNHDIVENFNTCMEGDFSERMVAAIGEKMYREYQEATKLDYKIQNPIWKKKINHNCNVIIVERINKIHPSNSPFPNILSERLKIEMDCIKQGTIILTFTTAPIIISDNRIFKCNKKQRIWRYEDLKLLYDLMYSWIRKDCDKRSIILVGGGSGSGSESGMNGTISRGNITIPFFITGPITCLTDKSGLFKKCLLNKYDKEYTIDKFHITITQITFKENFLNMIVDTNGCITASLIFED